MAEHTHITAERRPESALIAAGRRSLMATAPLLALALAAPAQAVDASADAEVIRLCALFQAAHDASHATVHLDDADDDENAVWLKWLHERDRLGDLIEAMPAVTIAGQRAKARAALTLLDESHPQGMDGDGLMAVSVLCDILGDVA